MNIAFLVFVDIPDGGAVASRVLMMAKGLVSLGHKVTILVPYRYSPGPLTEEIDDVEVWRGKLINPTESTAKLAVMGKRLLLIKNLRSIMAQGLDWLIIYDMGLDALPFLLLAERYGCLVASDNCDIRLMENLRTLQDLYYYFSYAIGNYLILPHLDLNLAISRFIEHDLKKMAPRVPTVIVPAPVDMEKFSLKREESGKFKQKWGLADEIIIGYMGTHFALKGSETLIRAIAQVLLKGYAVKLLLTGNIDRNKNIIQLINDLNLTRHCVLTGLLPQQELITAMSAADILVEPKSEVIQNQAAFPQKLAEYLAMGKPIVASAIGDIPLYLRDGENALLVKPGDPDSLAQALIKLIDSHSLRNKLASQAIATARLNFDCKKIAHKLEQALIKIANKSIK